jgi:hypothetical protein
MELTKQQRRVLTLAKLEYLFHTKQMPNPLTFPGPVMLKQHMRPLASKHFYILRAVVRIYGVVLGLVLGLDMGSYSLPFGLRWFLKTCAYHNTSIYLCYDTWV